jgi:hypothetical protein
MVVNSLQAQDGRALSIHSVTGPSLVIATRM